MPNSLTLLFHDYETWGINPKLDFPVQFAALRTNSDLEVIGEPFDIFCQIPNDYLPNPEAVMVTGITPQASLSKGLLETQFADKIYNVMSEPNTCVVGYNSLNFDDEVTRHLFYRNFLPVYEREYLNKNSRWDIIDLVRATFVLRPETLNWVFSENGTPIFKLDRLSAANSISHENAHEALSDVYATIAIAKKIKSTQSRLYDFYFSLRSKDEVVKWIGLDKKVPLLYISGVISPKQGCATWIIPICPHPSNTNAIIAIDLSKPLEPLLDLSPTELIQSLFSSNKKEQKPGVLIIRTNKCPFVAPAKMLSPERAEEIGLNRDNCLENYQRVKNNTHIIDKLAQAFDTQAPKEFISENVDEMLYERDFPSRSDKQNMEIVRNSRMPLYSELKLLFDDIHFKRQLFRFIGRNYPSNFDDNEMQRWQEYRHDRLSNGNGCISISEFVSTIETLMTDNANKPNKLDMLKRLYAYAQNL